MQGIPYRADCTVLLCCIRNNICVLKCIAAGTAVSIAYRTNKDVHTVDIKALQKKLADNGAVL